MPDKETSPAQAELKTPTGIGSTVLLAVNRDKLKYRVEKWKATKSNKQREMLILKTEIETMELLIGETEDIINDERNLQSVCGQ